MWTMKKTHIKRDIFIDNLNVDSQQSHFVDVKLFCSDKIHWKASFCKLIWAFSMPMFAIWYSHIQFHRFSSSNISVVYHFKLEFRDSTWYHRSCGNVCSLNIHRFEIWSYAHSNSVERLKQIKCDLWEKNQGKSNKKLRHVKRETWKNVIWIRSIIFIRKCRVSCPAIGKSFSLHFTFAFQLGPFCLISKCSTPINSNET